MPGISGFTPDDGQCQVAAWVVYIRHPARSGRNLFVGWQPPKGFAFKAHYALVDGSGGIALIEADSEAALYDGSVSWAPFLEFRTVPVVEIDKAVPIALV